MVACECIWHVSARDDIIIYQIPSRRMLLFPTLAASVVAASSDNNTTLVGRRLGGRVIRQEPAWPYATATACSDQREHSQPSFFRALGHLGLQGRKQDVTGPMQDDEALLLLSLMRATGSRRALEIGGAKGFSARTMLAAVECESNGRVYTIDRKSK